MKKNRILKKIAVALLICAVALPVWAQTNSSDAASNSTVSESQAATHAVAKSEKSPASGDFHLGFGKTLVALSPTLVSLAPFIFAFGIIVAILTIKFYAAHRRQKMVNEILRAMIEKGMSITPEIVDSLNVSGQTQSSVGNLFPRRGRHPRLLPGLVLTGVGVALLISGGHRSTGGWIVLFIGIAFLIVWSVERKDQNNLPPNLPKP